MVIHPQESPQGPLHHIWLLIAFHFIKAAKSVSACNIFLTKDDNQKGSGFPI